MVKLNIDEQIIYRDFSDSLSNSNYRAKMNNVDFDFFITSLVLSGKEKSCVMITNDFGIIRGWSDYIRDNYISPSKLGVAVRRELNEFEIFH